MDVFVRHKGACSGFSIWNIHDFVDVRPDLGFICTLIDNADAEDDRKMRDDLKLSTLIEFTASNMGYEIEAGPISAYVPKQFVKHRFLGYTLCQVKLAAGQYSDTITSQLSIKDQIWAAIELNTIKTADDPIRTAWNHIYKRTSIEDSFALITDSCTIIGRLFNEIFAEAEYYPFILAGGRLMIDNSIVLLLLVMLLGAPAKVISPWHAQVLDEAAQKSDFMAGDPARARYRRSWVDQSAIWAESIEKLLNDKYGGIEMYLQQAGVELATQEKIKQLLKVPSEA